MKWLNKVYNWVHILVIVGIVMVVVYSILDEFYPKNEGYSYARKCMNVMFNILFWGVIIIFLIKVLGWW